ncbi:cyclase family protein [Wenxinia marina]|uniref:Putative metal-dependent hydrolase n=1 Tax=Wenxinia marina DSM 24838 TaxID=1123501 RepID=A0A0D0Q8K9_9RHOB|nr:cyclase family protein [Wenxinia marina]KIQ67463.1 putative metal-dependent hydrolase [Wenxinia marina DSM 24838]GGL69333.1 cyclase [Wenxinia marina]
MCNACLIENVKRETLSRRQLFTGAAAVGAASVAAGLMSARPLLAQASGRIVDLTHTYDETFPTFSGEPGIVYDKVYDLAADGYNLYKLTIDEHTGTHIDAPMHFSADGNSVDEIPVESLMCPLCVVDISAKASEDPNAMVEPEDIEAWTSANGDLPEGALVAMHSGWAAKVGDESFRGDGTNLAFPGFSKAATDLLMEAGAGAIGVDTLSLDPGNSADFAVHYSWLPSGRFGIECLTGLDQVPATGATAIVGAPKHRGGTGGPGRVFALL